MRWIALRIGTDGWYGCDTACDSGCTSKKYNFDANQVSENRWYHSQPLQVLDWYFCELM